MKLAAASVTKTSGMSSALVRLFATSLAILVMFCLTSTTAFAACTLGGTVSTWTDSNSNWNNSGNWRRWRAQQQHHQRLHYRRQQHGLVRYRRQC